jgi:hypothetical protein
MPFIELDTHKILKRMDEIMAAIDDLNTAVATLQATVNTVVTALGTSGTPGTSNDAQVEVDVATINAANAALQAALAPGTVVTTPVATSAYPASYPANYPAPANYPSGPMSTLHGLPLAPSGQVITPSGQIVTHPIGSVPAPGYPASPVYPAVNPDGTPVVPVPKPGDPGYRQTR